MPEDEFANLLRIEQLEKKFDSIDKATDELFGKQEEAISSLRNNFKMLNNNQIIYTKNLAKSNTMITELEKKIDELERVSIAREILDGEKAVRMGKKDGDLPLSVKPTDITASKPCKHDYLLEVQEIWQIVRLRCTLCGDERYFNEKSIKTLKNLLNV